MPKLKNLLSLFKEWRKNNIAFPWVVFFLFINLSVTQYGGTNANARIAGLRAITESGTLNIDPYVNWTIDWSKSPNGHYYSNKAPGGVIFGLPFFAAVDIPVMLLTKDKRNAQGYYPGPGYIQHIILILFTQLLPFSLLVLLISDYLQQQGFSRMSVHIFSLCALFGNTAAVYMNCYFGHGLAAVHFLACFFFWLQRRYGWSSFFFASSLLTDYGTAYVFPFFVIATLLRERTWKPALAALIGASPIAAIWTWYHWVAFGSPLATANQFINPQQIEKVQGPSAIDGAYSIFPSAEVFYRLLFGPERGLLFLLPWALAVFPIFFYRTKNIPTGAKTFLVGGLLGLLWMNASFGGWHGGWTVGPRYISLIFPALALLVGMAWDSIPRSARLVLFICAIVSVAFRIWIYPFSNLAPVDPLWSYYFVLYDLVGLKSTGGLRISMALFALGATLFWVSKREKSPMRF